MLALLCLIGTPVETALKAQIHAELKRHQKKDEKLSVANTCENANLILEQCLGAALYLSVSQKAVFC